MAYVVTDEEQEINARIKNEYGAQNLHILNSLAEAYSAALRLVEQGVVLLEVRIGSRSPLIMVQNNAAAHTLKHATRIRRPGIAGIERVRVAAFERVQVEWTERGN